MPLIVLLHGLGQSAADITRASGLPARAAARGMAVVTPNALGTPALWQMGPTSRDATFLDALIKDVEASHCIDTGRVGIVGFSAGAAFGNAYGCARQDDFDALVTISVEFGGPCSRPMPYLAFHGTADPVVAYSGTAQNMQGWASAAGCGPASTATLNPSVTRMSWEKCADGTQVVLSTIVGGGHEWPPSNLDFSVSGTRPRSATDEIVLFLSKQHRSAASTTTTSTGAQAASLSDFCARLPALTSLVDQVPDVGQPNIAASTAIAVAKRHLVDAAPDAALRDAASHIADAAIARAGGRPASEAETAASTSALAQVTAACSVRGRLGRARPPSLNSGSRDQQVFAARRAEAVGPVGEVALVEHGGRHVLGVDESRVAR